MDFVKLKELPRNVGRITADSDTRRFKAFKKRLEESCGVGTDVNAMCFSPASESSQLAVACGSRVQLVELGFSSVTEICSWSKHKNIVTALAFRKDGKLMIAGDGDGSANIYDVSITKGIIRRLRGHDGAIHAVTFCGNGTRVATGGQDQSVKIWDVPTGQVQLSLRGHTDSVRAIVAVGENTLISAGADGKLIQWDIRGSGEKLIEVSHGSPIERLAIFDSGALLFSIGGGNCKLWDIGSMKEVREMGSVKHTKPVTSAVVSGCGDFLATSSFDMTVKITRIATWEVITSFSSPNAITSMAWRGNELVHGSEVGTWTLRQRRGVSGAEGAPEDVNMSTKTDETRYYKTVELSPTISNMAVSTGKESTADFMFRKFEYKKLIDYLLNASVGGALAIAIVDELIQRGGLVASLRDRPVDEVARIVEWSGRNLLVDYRCSIRIVSQVIDALIEGNREKFANPEAQLVNALKMLNGRLAQEMTLQLRASALAGLIESVI
jgi:U3 small nucleolar RNA-associated protein 15